MKGAKEHRVQYVLTLVTLWFLSGFQTVRPFLPSAEQLFTPGVVSAWGQTLLCAQRESL